MPFSPTTSAAAAAAAAPGAMTTTIAVTPPSPVPPPPAGAATAAAVSTGPPSEGSGRDPVVPLVTHLLERSASFQSSEPAPRATQHHQPSKFQSYAAAASKTVAATLPLSPVHSPRSIPNTVTSEIQELSASPSPPAAENSPLEQKTSTLTSMTRVVPLTLLAGTSTPRSPSDLKETVTFESLEAIGQLAVQEDTEVPSISIESAAPQTRDSLSMTLNGVRLSFVLDFVGACGGRDALIGLTTADVSQRWIVPSTSSSRLSAVDHLLLHDRGDVVCPANWFISHAWSFHFLDVVDALVGFFKVHNVDPVDAVIWFDMFSNSQHDTNERPFEWWEETFMGAVKSIQNVVMVLLPWNDPVPLKRAWCVFEVFATARTNSKFHVAMPPSVASDFFSNLVDRPPIFYEVLSKISCTRSSATLESDRKLIFEVIDRTLPDGMAALDALVRNVFGQWLLKMIKTYYDRAMTAVAELDKGATDAARSIPSVTVSPTANSIGSAEAPAKSIDGSESVNERSPRDVARLEAAQWSYALGRLCDDQGDHRSAEPLYKFCVDTKAAILGRSHPSTLLAMFRQHDNLSHLGRRVEALELAQECLALRQQAGCSIQDILSSKNSIANALLFLGRIAEAVALHEEVLDGRKKVLGVAALETLRSMNNLANAYKQLPDLKRAALLYTESFEQRVQSLGENHPDTLKSMFNIAEFRRETHQYRRVDEVLKVFEDTYQKRRTVLGEAHPDTVASLLKLANTLLFDKSDPGEAVEVLSTGLARVASTAGRSSLPALQIKRTLATALDSAGDAAAASRTYRECLDSLRAKLDDPTSGVRDAANVAGELERVERALAKHERWAAKDRGSLYPGRGG
ncbi:hypothetical protein DFJ73DRAFT_642349, partial [Zopfochytrium polystomum]